MALPPCGEGQLKAFFSPKDHIQCGKTRVMKVAINYCQVLVCFSVIEELRVA